jgi:hypothetical protein
MNRASVVNEIPGLAITAARLGIAEIMVRKVRNNESILLTMAIFIAADIGDGAFLRKLGRDTPVRRFADSVVDQVSVARVGYEVAKQNPAMRPYLGVLALRATYSGIVNVAHQGLTGEVTKGGNFQKSVSLATAAFGVSAANGDRLRTHASGVIASVAAIASVPSHTKEFGVRHSSGIREL